MKATLILNGVAIMLLAITSIVLGVKIATLRSDFRSLDDRIERLEERGPEESLHEEGDCNYDSRIANIESYLAELDNTALLMREQLLKSLAEGTDHEPQGILRPSGKSGAKSENR